MSVRRRLVWLVVALVMTGACVKKVERLATAPAKKRVLTASREQVIELIRQYSAVQTIKYGRLGVEVEGYYPDQEKKESYPRGSGYMVVQQPQWILMNINNPLTRSTVASMAANGTTFQLFIPGDNKYVTGSVDVSPEGDNPFYHIRPQHVAEAIFVRPLKSSSQEIFYVYEDSDARFSYYGIAEVNVAASPPRLIRRLWIERSEMQLARQQLYGPDGELVSDASYGEQVRMGGLPVFLQISLLRPLDRYRLRFSFEADAARVNEPLEESAFTVAQPPGAEVVEVKKKDGP
ncbi:MAG: hypothetical protein HY315_02200 [Acidobacteria bacterium]|nr:hypothetical protein [Acidobacteriota bacterium]